MSRNKTFLPKSRTGSVLVTYKSETVLRGTVNVTCERWSHDKDCMTRFYNVYGQLVYEIPTADIIGPLSWFSHGG